MRHWLERTLAPDAQRIADIVLASYEALSNSAAHAYPDEARGNVTLDATSNAATNTVCIRVSDHGTWVDPDAQPADSAHGRGLPLIEALCDRAWIEATAHGTTVHLQFDHCPPRPSPHNPAATSTTGHIDNGQPRSDKQTTPEHETSSTPESNTLGSETFSGDPQL